MQEFFSKYVFPRGKILFPIFLLIFLVADSKVSASNDLEAEFVTEADPVNDWFTVTVRVKLASGSSAFSLGDASIEFALSNTTHLTGFKAGGSSAGSGDVVMASAFSSYTLNSSSFSSGAVTVVITEGGSSFNLTSNYQDFVTIKLANSGDGSDQTNVSWNSTSSDFELFSGSSTVDAFTGNNLSNAPLPVDMLHSNAEQVDLGKILVSWTTASEVNCDRFDIKIPWAENMDAEILATVLGNGNSTEVNHYQTVIEIDPGIPVGIRLVIEIWQHDFDGEYEIFRIPFKIKETNVVRITPNPLEPGKRIVDISLKNETSTGRVTLTDMTGKALLEKDFAGKFVSIQIPNHLSPGNYFLSISDYYHVIETKKIAVQ